MIPGNGNETPEGAPGEAGAREAGGERGGWFGRLKRGLAKTRASFLGGPGSALSGRSRDNISEIFADLEEALYAADLGPKTVETILERLRSGTGGAGRTGGEGSPAERVRAIILSLIDTQPGEPQPGQPPQEEPPSGEPHAAGTPQDDPPSGDPPPGEPPPVEPPQGEPR
ncbi:MAG: signal recognition particle receptor subunit alpha, partial [bacterium]